MHTKAIIFDKDGTLTDFDALWLTITENALDIILNRLQRTDIPKSEFLNALGVTDGITRVDGILCHGSYSQIYGIILKVLAANNCSVHSDELPEIVMDAYRNSISKGIVKSACPNIREFLLSLKEREIVLAVVTSDTSMVTDKCLCELNIKDLFDIIYTNDGQIPAKPDPYCINDLCNRFNLKKDELLMVGDTFTDIHFARNGGIPVICVAKNEINRKILSKETDIIVHDISYITDYLN